MVNQPVLLLVSPHADDEILGLPSLMLSARDAGWRVVNLLCFLRPDQRARRRREAEAATTVLGIELRLAREALLSASTREDPSAAAQLVHDEVALAIDELCPTIVSSPSPHDVHHAHEAVARGVRAALQTAGPGVRWSMWAWWGELPLPTAAVGYRPGYLEEATHALREHRGELERLDLIGALEARARWNAATGPERVIGAGYRPDTARLKLADLLTEACFIEGRWTAGVPRVIDAAGLLSTPLWNERDLTAWLDAPSAVSLAPRASRC